MKKRAHKERLELAIQIKEIDRQYAHTSNPELYKKQVELQTKPSTSSQLIQLNANCYSPKGAFTPMVMSLERC